MITFLDGPAEGRKLDLGRVPYFLRVVVDRDGGVDALDQLDDQIRDTETAHVYVRAGGQVSTGFVCSRGRGGKGCQRLLACDYRLHGTQPAQAILRDNEAWTEWATAEGTAVAPQPLTPEP